MKLLLTYIPFQLLLGVLLGILIPLEKDLFVAVSIVLLILMFVSKLKALCIYKNKLLFLTIFFGGFLISSFSVFLKNDLYTKNHYICDLKKEVFLKLRIIESLSSSKKSDRYFGEVIRIDRKKSSGKILIVVNKDSLRSKLVLGDEFVCKTNIRKINLPPSPYDFNYRNYLKHKQVFGRIKVENYLKTGKKSNLIWTIRGYRSQVIAKVNQSILSKNTKGLLIAILLGDRDFLSKEIKTSFTNAGVVHLIAISGMHVGVLYFMLLSVLSFLNFYKKGNYIQVVIVLIFLWFFAVFSGLSSSVVRSVTMFSFISLARLHNRKGLLLEPIISSMLLLLIVHPAYLFDVGFQLSYSAVSSIVSFYPLITQKIAFKNKIATYFTDVVIISVAAQLGVLPVVFYYFHQIPLQFLVANFIAVSALPLVIYGGIIVVCKLCISDAFLFIENYYDFFIEKYIAVIAYFSSMDALILKNITLHPFHVFLSFVLLFLLWNLLKAVTYTKIVSFGLCVLLFQFTYIYYQYKVFKKQELIVYNDYRNLAITIKNKYRLMVYQHTLSKEYFRANKRNNCIDEVKKIENDVFQFKEVNYIVINKNYAYDKIKTRGLILIIDNNPKINMMRVVSMLKPKKVIVTAKNYQSNVEKWKNTCNNLQVPFYNIATKGAYVIN